MHHFRATEKATDKHDRIETACRRGGMLRVVAGTEQPDTLPWCAVAAVTPPGERMSAGKPIPASHPILCAPIVRRPPHPRDRAVAGAVADRAVLPRLADKHACLREQDGIGPCHTEPSPQWDGFDSQDADVVGQAAYGNTGTSAWDNFDSQDGDVTQAGTHASPHWLRGPSAMALPCTPQTDQKGKKKESKRLSTDKPADK